MVDRQKYADLRDAVAKLCDDFSSEYWRKLDRDNAYPIEFVEALTKAGWLAALIPETYGGAGLPLSAAAAILEEIHKSGGNADACHAQMYTMGTLLRHGSAEQKQKYLPQLISAEKIACYCLTEPGSGSDAKWANGGVGELGQ